MALYVTAVDENSPAERFGLTVGCALLAIDGHPLNDALDYQFYTTPTSFSLEVCENEQHRTVQITKAEYEPLGCNFKTYLGDEKHSCANHCMFCFIDQLPPGMREPLYFKDDDERLSFLFGNYITLTNLTDHEIDRIIQMHISPIFVSVHTTNPALRVRMLANTEEIRARSGCDFRLKTVAVRNPNRKRDLPEGVALTTDPMSLADDPDIDVIIELMGGIDAPKRLITRSLENGKQVITANKALLAEEGAGLFRLAEEKGSTLLYEASVAGGIPIVQTLKESLTGNRITSLEGILNGTGNYILSEMTSKGVDFASALSEAQAKGYAEADPTLDIDGFDTAHKLVLLIRLAWGVNYPYTEMPIEGIRNLDKMDIDFAREFGYRIKLLGRDHS